MFVSILTHLRIEKTMSFTHVFGTFGTLGTTHFEKQNDLHTLDTEDNDNTTLPINY